MTTLKLVCRNGHRWEISGTGNGAALAKSCYCPQCGSEFKAVTGKAKGKKRKTATRRR